MRLAWHGAPPSASPAVILRGVRRGALVAAGCSVAALVTGGSVAAQERIFARATLEPPTVKVGQPTTYRGTIVYRRSPGASMRWLPPDSSAWLAWGALRPRLHRGSGYDTLVVEARVQAFRPGAIVIPGLAFANRYPDGAGIRRLPTVRLIVASVLTPAYSNADLRPVRGPLAAPWWERVPWRWVVLGVLVLAGLVTLVVWLRRRRRRAAPVVEPVRALDPAAEALARLDALRARRLPEAGRFGEHALELTRILRVFLEATTGASRPGDTTTELSAGLESSSLDAAERRALVDLLRGWDRVKFARAASTVEEARRSESAVEQFVRRRAPAPAPAPERKAA